jgi:hypothetical protein
LQVSFKESGVHEGFSEMHRPNRVDCTGSDQGTEGLGAQLEIQRCIEDQRGELAKVLGTLESKVALFLRQLKVAGVCCLPVIVGHKHEGYYRADNQLIGDQKKELLLGGIRSKAEEAQW